MPIAKANGIDIYYEIKGQGPRLLFLGGTGGDLRLRPGPLEWPWADDFQMLAFDQRGQGRSGKPDQPYTMAQYADDAAALLEQVGWQPCAAAGYSFGGMVAQELALRHPHRLTRLALISTTSGGQGGASYPLHEIFALPLEQRATRLLALSDLRCTPEWQEQNQEQWQQLMQTSLEQMRLASADEKSRAGRARQLEARKQHGTFDRLGGLDLPVLVAAGRHDGVAALDAQQAMAAAIDGARLEVFEGGHLFFLQDPAAFERITAFLKG